MNKASKRGLSLIQTSMVIVIMALLVISVVSGRYIIERVNLNKLMVDLATYKVAYKRFYEKYEAAPGDMSNATNIWPDVTNGDGNDRIDLGSEEPVYAWQHLSRSGIIQQHYIPTSQGPDGIGKSFPAGPFSGTGYQMYYYIYPNGFDSYGFTDAIVSGTILQGGQKNGYLTSRQAYEIDKKIDDGEPLQGFILSYIGDYAFLGGDSGDCVDNANDNNYDNDSYVLTANRAQCVIIQLINKPYKI